MGQGISQGIQAVLQQWPGWTPIERGRQFNQLVSEEQQELFKGLPPREQQALFRGLSLEQRRQMMDPLSLETQMGLLAGLPLNVDSFRLLNGMADSLQRKMPSIETAGRFISRQNPAAYMLHYDRFPLHPDGKHTHRISFPIEWTFKRIGPLSRLDRDTFQRSASIHTVSGLEGDPTEKRRHGLLAYLEALRNKLFRNMAWLNRLEARVQHEEAFRHKIRQVQAQKEQKQEEAQVVRETVKAHNEQLIEHAEKEKVAKLFDLAGEFSKIQEEAYNRWFDLQTAAKHSQPFLHQAQEKYETAREKLDMLWRGYHETEQANLTDFLQGALIDVDKA